MLLEVPGEGSANRADKLAQKLRKALSDTGASITRPVKCVDLRVAGLEMSTTSEEVAASIAEAGGYAAADIKVGEIHRAPSGLGTVWLQCPAVATKKVVALGRIRLGVGAGGGADAQAVKVF